MEIILCSLFTATLAVSDTVRVPVRYGDENVEVHLYSPASLRLSWLNVSMGSRSMPILPPTLSHRNLLSNPLSRSSPLTSHVKEKLCPSLGCPLAVMLADNAGAEHIMIMDV